MGSRQDSQRASVGELAAAERRIQELETELALVRQAAQLYEICTGPSHKELRCVEDCRTS
jgi:hypothetical protein